MSSYLLEHPNPHGRHFYPERRGGVLAAVIHITAGLQGKPAGADSSAEQTARYAATTDRAVSWHSGSDRDSYLQLLPDTYTAWHCQGYNSRTIGHEISKRDITWADEDPQWVTETLEMAAACLRPRLARLGIPIRLATRAELDRAIATGGKPVGLIGHDVLDPTRRRDPGDFPWVRFLHLLRPTTPAPSRPTSLESDLMALLAKNPNGPEWYALPLSLAHKVHIKDDISLDALKGSGLYKEASLTVKQLTAIPTL